MMRPLCDDEPPWLIGLQVLGTAVITVAGVFSAWYAMQSAKYARDQARLEPVAKGMELAQEEETDDGEADV